MTWQAGPIAVGDTDPEWVVNAQWDDTDRWNGWLCPALDPHGVEQILTTLDNQPESDIYGHRWLWAQDRDGTWCLVIVEVQWLDEPEAHGDGYPVEVIDPDTDGLYRLGNYSWTWFALSSTFGEGPDPDLCDGLCTRHTDTCTGDCKHLPGHRNACEKRRQ